MQELKNKCDKIWEKVSNAISEDGRQLSVMFLRLPSKSYYPDYYRLINQPISMKQIKNKIYNSPEEFRSDFQIMFKNAQTYNEEGSVVYNDSLILRVLFV